MTNENKAFDQNLDENVYIDVALDLIALLLEGERPNDEQIAGIASVEELNVDTLKEAVEREFNNLQQIKNSLDSEEVEREPMLRNQVAFPEIHRFLYDMMSEGIKISGSYVDSLSVIEERLTIHEFLTLEAFYKWIEAGNRVDFQGIGVEVYERGFGSGNYNERYKEWLATLEEK